VDATIAGVEGITGLDVHYFAMVDLRGFRKLVDALGGLELNVLDRIPIGGVGGPVTGYIEPGRQHLNGFQTLWFARSREGADDYSRMARQKCVMHAMLQQLSPRTVVTKLSRIAEASTDVLTTNIPASELHRFIPLALKAKAQPLKTVSFVPPAINTADPDIEQIQRRVQHAIDRAETGPGDPQEPASQERGAGDHGDRTGGTGSGTGEGAPMPQAPTTGGSVGSLAEGYAANDTSDLSSAC
jgi:anionic cell wall polymer biosynthesis LytR-Cps2A-Psr (LCP) family protein